MIIHQYLLINWLTIIAFTLGERSIL